MILPIESAYAVAATLLLFGAPLAVLGHVFTRSIRAFNARCIAAAGTVVGHREVRTESTGIWRTVYFPIVEFTTPDGRAHRADGIGEAAPPQLGASVALLYDPLQPGAVSFTGPRGRAGVARSLKAVGLTMVALAPCVVGLALVL